MADENVNENEEATSADAEVPLQSDTDEPVAEVGADEAPTADARVVEAPAEDATEATDAATGSADTAEDTTA